MNPVGRRCLDRRTLHTVASIVNPSSEPELVAPGDRTDREFGPGEGEDHPEREREHPGTEREAGMRLMDFTGARRIPLIGRHDLLREAERRMGRGGVHLIYLEGEGGIGKTAVLEAILEQSQRGALADAMASCCVGQEPIDLYEVDVHSSEGLIRRIIDVLGRWSFEQSCEALSALDQARTVGDMETASRQAKALQDAFFEEFSWLTREGVVLALDTLEVLNYEDDPFQDELGEEMPVLSAGEWLVKSFFPALSGNVLLLLAGRPSGLLKRLEALRQDNGGLLLHHVPLEALTEEETREYLKVIAQNEGRRGDGSAAARLWAFGEEHGDVVHALTGGRPILLALVVDLLAHGWELPPAFHDAEGAAARGEVGWWPDVERELVARLQESPSPIGETLRAMAWLRKGATPELLARVMDLRTSDGDWDVHSASGYLEQVGQLALVKVQRATRRVFLHDEIYALLEEHVLQACPPEERDRVYRAIQAYYREMIRDLEKRVEEFPPALGSIQAILRQAYAEEMHYRLRQSPPLGFAMYFWLAEEAVGGRDAEMDMLLRTEFLRTLGALSENGYHLGHIPRESEIDTAVRWGLRALFFQSDPERALVIFDQVRRRWGREAGKLRLGWAHLQLCRAAALIQRAEGIDWQEARTLLTTVEQVMEEMLCAPPESDVVKGRRWQAKIMKSLALNYLGYLDRQQGRYLDAVRHYQQSAMLQRRLGMSALATTLTNLSYAMALTGEFHHARLLAEEAERLARRSGKDHVLATTLNVRALVEGYGDHHRSALSYADRALDVAARLPSPRVKGLIFLTRARAHRYLWDSLSEAEQQLAPQAFPEALIEANQAVKLLRSNPADRVDALLERGCVYRGLARAHYLQGNMDEAHELAGQARKDLERAAVLAAAVDLPAQQASAWTNLGWLHYYVGQLDEMAAALEQAYSPFPREYIFPEQGPLPPVAQNGQQREASLPYWVILGKAEMLKAYLALDEAQTASDKESHETSLRTAVRHITLSLAYDELIADAHFDLTKAEENLHRRILQDNLNIKSLHQHAQEAAEEQGLPQPTRFQRYLNRMFGPADLWS